MAIMDIALVSDVSVRITGIGFAFTTNDNGGRSYRRVYQAN